MGFGKLRRKLRSASHKASRIAHTVSRKAPGILNKVGSEMVVAGKIGEAASGVLAMTGQEELAVPLLGASETLKYSGKAVKGAARAADKAKKGNVLGAVNEVEKTVTQYKKDTSPKEGEFK